MTDKTKHLLPFVEVNVEQALYALRNIIEAEQYYEKTVDLVRIEELKDIRRKLKHEILYKIREMQ